MAGPDAVDAVTDQWRSRFPDRDFGDMALVGRFGRVHAHLARAVERPFAERGLSVGEGDVLFALRRSGPPYVLTPSQLSRTLMLSPGGMTARLDKLEAAGLVERELDPGNRRSFKITLTDLGRATADALLDDHLDNEARLLAPLSEADRRGLDRGLRKLLASLEPPER
jgi:DNA-binding MarR family transcriptional regulator